MFNTNLQAPHHTNIKHSPHFSLPLLFSKIKKTANRSPPSGHQQYCAFKPFCSNLTGATNLFGMAVQVIGLNGNENF